MSRIGSHVRDVLLCLIPPTLTMIVTLALMHLSGVQANYINIVMFPIIFGIGVIIGRDEKGEARIIKWDKTLSEDDRDYLLLLFSDENSGDMLLQGAFDGRKIVNFEEQLSGHGGIGSSCQGSGRWSQFSFLLKFLPFLQFLPPM